MCYNHIVALWSLCNAADILSIKNKKLTNMCTRLRAHTRMHAHAHAHTQERLKKKEKYSPCSMTYRGYDISANIFFDLSEH